MPVRDQALTVHYACRDKYTGALTADAPANHTFTLLRDGAVVTPADSGSTTSKTGVNKLAIAAGENSGDSNLLIIETSSADIYIDDVSWGNSLPKQDIRDAMKLAPTAGAAAAGSVDSSIAALVLALNGLDSVQVTSPIVGSILNITRGVAYDGTREPKITVTCDSDVDITSDTGTLTIRTISDDGSGTALLTLTTTDITLVSGTTYSAAFACSKSQSESLDANLTLATQTLEGRIDGWEDQVRWDVNFNMKFDIVLETGTSRREILSGICLVKENQTQVV